MAVFRHPAFAKLSAKIDRAEKELREIERYWSAHLGAVSVGDWGAVSAVSLGIHNVYNGIEDILLSLSKDIDGLSSERDVYFRCLSRQSFPLNRSLQATTIPMSQGATRSLATDQLSATEYGSVRPVLF